jgi:hypothetical protein
MSLRLVESALQRTPRVTVNGNPIYMTSAIAVSGFDLSTADMSSAWP